MHLFSSLLLAGASLSLIQAQPNAGAILPQVAQKRAFTGSIGTISATGTVVSGTATPTGNGTIISNGTTGYNGTYPGPPVPYTGGSGSIRGCGVVVLAGLLVGAMVVVL